jgi:hypothetical protein
MYGLAETGGDVGLVGIVSDSWIILEKGENYRQQAVTVYFLCTPAYSITVLYLLMKWLWCRKR